MSPGSVEMGDIKRSRISNGSSRKVDSMEARLLNFCKSGLSLDDEATKEALRLFRETKHILFAIIAAPDSGNPEDHERFWFASVLYTVKQLIGGNSVNKGNQADNDTGFTLYQILKVSKIKIASFLNEMPQFFIKADSILSKLYGNDWEKKLQAKELQANFVHMTFLCRHFKRAYQDFFLSGNDLQDKSLSAVANGGGPVSTYLRFGWMLFLALRIHVFSRFKDMVTCTNGLVSILAILILHVPIRYRRFSLDDSTRFVRKCDKGVDLISSLSNIFHASEVDLLETSKVANNLIVEILNKTPRPASECQAEELKDIDTDAFSYFEGLMEESSLVSSIQILEKDYEDAIYDRGELDERMFVNEEDSLFGSGSNSGGSVTVSGVKRKFDSISSPTKTITSTPSPRGSPVASPVKESSATASIKMPPPTPVSTAMTTAKWLRTVIAPLPPKPSTELGHFLSSCDRDITADVSHRARIILEAIFPSSSPGERCVAGSLQSASLMDSIWAEQRRMEALKLYYRVLAAMCRAESNRLRSRNLTSLLTNERFHRCMLACSAELVLATHKTVTMMFPAVLERSGITAFDLSKVIESFVRHEETLPRELKRHLNNLEERILESMAWEKGSSMYNSLIVAKSSLSAEINRLRLLADPLPSLDAIAMQYGAPTAIPQRTEASSDPNVDTPSSPQRLATTVVSNETTGVTGEHNSFVSPVKERSSAFSAFPGKSRQPPLQSAFASPTRPNPYGGGETCADTTIYVFCQKVLKLAAIRIKCLSDRLQQPNLAMEQVYRLLNLVLREQTGIFFNRHIDQVILCSFYGIAKIQLLNLTFREIINNYRKQPQCKPQVFRNVFVESRRYGRSGHETVDIIAFYNRVFIPAVKPLLVKFAPSESSVEQSHGSEDTEKSDGPSPGSPGSSPFQRLPDMSPKKVSATHNVYVSPLRSAKMENLNSHNSKSYYACVGESTHAYQSPSKDLTAINNRLNSRRVSSRLNFDDPGLVSDSVVAGSLYPSQSSLHLTSDSVLSQSQSQSQSQSVLLASSASPIKHK